MSKKESKIEAENQDTMSDIRYICKSCALITEALQKGSDVMQMPNGDIVVSEIKTVTFLYTWDDKKGKLVRVQSGNKIKKNKNKITEEEVEQEKISELV
jgi:hypothetical protein